MTTVMLHVGAFKSGTSYLQSVLAAGRDELATEGVLWPGTTRLANVAAARGLLKLRPAKLTAWDALVAEIDQWPGERALVSAETLSMVGAAGVARAAESLSRHRVHIVLTARDLGRVLPAQWQESVQNGKTWSYVDYLSAVAGDDESHPAHQHFWSKQSWPTILRRWKAVSDDAQLMVVTVPPPDKPRDLLWSRFCEALGIRPERFDASLRVNESLGAASAEVMRYVSLAMEHSASPLLRSKAFKDGLAQGALSARKDAEPTLVLPEALRPWAATRSQELVDALRSVEATVVGDLDDLAPTFHPVRDGETEDPATLPLSTVMESAADGLLGLMERLVDAGVVPFERDELPQ
jgi:hypothetical protein